MRPTGDTGKYTIATNVKDGNVQVVVNALNKDDEFLDFLEMNATALDSELTPIPLSMRQTAPGRYVGSFPAEAAGSYFVNVVPGPGEAPLTTGVTVPYSDEYRVRETNMALIQTLAETEPRGGKPGEVTEPLPPQPALATEQSSDPFRGGLALARSIRDAWPWFILAGSCLFLGDVMVRRIAFDPTWITNWIRRMSGEKDDSVERVTRLDALRKNKEQLDDDLQRRRASVRFEPTRVGADEPDELAGMENASAANSPSQSVEKPAQKTYTERLLEAKRRARKDGD